METKWFTLRTVEDKESIAQAADILRRGGLLAIPTETVYGLAGNGLDPAAVAQIYEIKGRPAVKPLSLMVHDASAMARYCDPVPQAAHTLAEAFWPGPLTIVLRAKACVPEIVRAGGQTVGLRCPDHPATLALIEAAQLPLAAPAAQTTRAPPPRRSTHAARTSAPPAPPPPPPPSKRKLGSRVKLTAFSG